MAGGVAKASNKSFMKEYALTHVGIIGFRAYSVFLA